MKKSELKGIIKEALDKRKKQKLQEAMVGGEQVAKEVVSAIMVAVPALVSLGAAINWKEEIADWIKQMKVKYAK